MNFLKCVCYLLTVAVLGFFLGRLLPQKWLQPEKGLFCCFAFEQEGKLYEKLGIRKWHRKLPDISRILPFWVPPKNLAGDFGSRLPEMIRETCVAELVHLLEGLAGLYCLWLWPGIGGVVISGIFLLLLNLPFVLIQRYNRPRLLRLQKKFLNRQK